MTELTGDQLAQAEASWLGKPYVWGGGNPAGWDCSGMQNWVLNIHFNLPIPGVDPGKLSGHGPDVAGWIGWSGVTTVQNPLDGDLVAWGPNEHIGMVTGGGRYISAYDTASGTIQGSIATQGGSGSPVYLRLNGTTPGTGSGTGSSGSGSGGSSSTDATATGGLDAADTQMLVSAGCLPGSWLIYMIMMKGQSWTSRRRRACATPDAT